MLRDPLPALIGLVLLSGRNDNQTETHILKCLYSLPSTGNWHCLVYFVCLVEVYHLVERFFDGPPVGILRSPRQSKFRPEIAY